MEPSTIMMIVYIILFIIGVPVIILIIRKLTYVEPTDTVVVNFNAHRTGGKAIGNLIKKTIGNNGRIHINYLPRTSKDMTPVTIITEPTKVIISTKGVWDNEKNIMMILPEDAKVFFSTFLNRVETLNGENMIIAGLKEGMSRAKGHLKNIGEGEITMVELGLLKDHANKIIDDSSKQIGKKTNPYQSSSTDKFVS